MADWWDNQVSGPANDAIIVDSGALAARSGQVVVCINSTLPGSFEFQHRDTNNSTVLHRQKVTIVTGQADISITGPLITVEENQHLVIVSKQALTLGTVGASIWMQ